MRKIPNWSSDSTLAVAYAECGDFVKAEYYDAKDHRKFLSNAEVDARRMGYREKKAYHRPPLSEQEVKSND